jgi:hypothetical protein
VSDEERDRTTAGVSAMIRCNERLTGKVWRLIGILEGIEGVESKIDSMSERSVSGWVDNQTA